MYAMCSIRVLEAKVMVHDVSVKGTFIYVKYWEILGLLFEHAILKVVEYGMNQSKVFRQMNRLLSSYVVSYMCQGHSRVRINNVNYYYNPGDVIFIPPHTIRDHVQDTNDECSYMWWNFTFEIANCIDVFRVFQFLPQIVLVDPTEFSKAFHKFYQFKTFFHIMLPLAGPGIASLFIFLFIWGWNDFRLPLLMIYKDQLRALPVGIMYYSNKYTTNQSLVAAGVTIASLPIVIINILFQKQFVQGLTAGAFKD